MKTNTITAIPRLRFPEFQKDKSWQAKPLIECASFINKKIELSSLNLTNYISTENILSDFGGVTKASKLPKNGKATHFIEEDILISNIRPYLRKVWFSNFIGGASNDVLVVRAKNEVNSKYLSSYLMTDRFINYVMTGAKGMKMPRGDISQIKKYDITYPNIEEQQKIADCLSSLDDSIEAEIQQLESLKTHKAGLLQNLFPVGEETVPNYRFAEFKDDEDWEEFDLIDVADKEIKWSFIGGPFGSNLKASDYTNKGIRVIQLQNIGDGEFVGDSEVYTSEEKANELLANNIYPNDIIMSKMGDPVGRACLIPDTHHRYVMCSDGIRLVVNEDKYNKYFIYSFINSPSFRDLIERKSTGSTRKRIGLSHLKDLKLLVPDITEQKKIANCLSSLDNLIQAKDEKIKILKQHKQGLMQQLFPVMDDK